MRYVFLLQLIPILIFNLKVHSQDLPFIRIYDLHGKKIGKGRLVKTSDNLLYTKLRKDTLIFTYREIGEIRTKRSYGNNIVVPAIILAAPSLPGVFSKGNTPFLGDDASWAAAGMAAGAITGVMIGSIYWLVKKKASFTINGDQVAWEEFRKSMVLIPDRKEKEPPRSNNYDP
ncbi:hypothetical protein [Robertkochia flava]|uniref:hypothetical protein n=1 Tax=Robertkochia flava TaxID=3447986 RepID=UPI001CCFCC4B|nr:hypothetical protein [Robertkochia marina]